MSFTLPAHIATAPSSTAARQPTYALVGNPNCGKSTLFNALTGLKQKVGNYPGVTVEKKVGTIYSQHGQPMTVIDLPGAYSLAARSPDEAVTRDVLLGRRADTPQPDRILCILDATNLERNLYLLHQILDLGRPVIVVLNMMDLAAAAGLNLRVGRLEQELGVPVIPCEAVNGKGLVELRLAMSRPELSLARHAWDVPAAIAPAVADLQASLTANDGKSPLIARAEALLLLTDQDSMRVAGSKPLSTRTTEILHGWQTRWSGEGTDWAGTLVNSRYDAIGQIAAEVVLQAGNTGPSTSDKIDAVVTHPVWGWLVLGGIMAMLFLSIFTLAEYPMNLIDGQLAAVADWVKASMPAGDLRDLITDGAIAGVGGVRNRYGPRAGAPRQALLQDRCRSRRRRQRSSAPESIDIRGLVDPTTDRARATFGSGRSERIDGVRPRRARTPGGRAPPSRLARSRGRASRARSRRAGAPRRGRLERRGVRGWRRGRRPVARGTRRTAR
jgi:ferrous iron transport protein B